MNSLSWITLVSNPAGNNLVLVGSTVLGVSYIVVWRLGEIRSSFSEAHTLSDFQNACFQMACVSLVDVFLLPMSVFIVLSPIRWPLLRLAFANPEPYDAWNFRGMLFSCAIGSIWDMFGYPLGCLAVFSPFGRIVTIWRSTEYYFRPHQNFNEKCDSLNRWSTRLILQGLNTIVDVWAVAMAVPYILLAPSVWTPTYEGLVELHSLNNLPTEPTTSKHYQRAWMEEYYEVLQGHLSNQLSHAILDSLLLPCYLVVSASPRAVELHRTIDKVKTERIAAREQAIACSSCVALLPEVSDLDYYYSFELRGDLCVLALLAVADFFWMQALLPGWLVQYRFITQREKKIS